MPGDHEGVRRPSIRTALRSIRPTTSWRRSSAARARAWRRSRLYKEYLTSGPTSRAAADALLKLNSLWKGYADAQGPVLAQDEKKRAEWTKGIENSSAAAEQILEKFPDSPAVALALNNLLDVQKSQAARAPDHRRRHRKILRRPRDEGRRKARRAEQNPLHARLVPLRRRRRTRRVKMMADAYKPELKYAPEDMDLYGKTLLDARTTTRRSRSMRSWRRTIPIPAGGDPKKAPKQSRKRRPSRSPAKATRCSAKSNNDDGGEEVQGTRGELRVVAEDDGGELRHRAGPARQEAGRRGAQTPARRGEELQRHLRSSAPMPCCCSARSTRKQAASTPRSTTSSRSAPSTRACPKPPPKGSGAARNSSNARRGRTSHATAAAQGHARPEGRRPKPAPAKKAAASAPEKKADPSDPHHG